jgi:hypothetical protein
MGELEEDDKGNIIFVLFIIVPSSTTSSASRCLGKGTSGSPRRWAVGSTAGVMAGFLVGLKVSPVFFCRFTKVAMLAIYN